MYTCQEELMDEIFEEQRRDREQRVLQTGFGLTEKVEVQAPEVVQQEQVQLVNQ